MRSESYKQYDFIREDAVEIFTDKVNKRMQELQYNSPEVEVMHEGRYMIAQIRYTQHVNIPEDLADIYEMQNVRFTCQDCPIFKPILNKDGTPDLRVKYGDCKYAEFGRTYKNSRCCDTLYKLFRTGEVRLCLAESES